MHGRLGGIVKCVIALCISLYFLPLDQLIAEPLPGNPAWLSLDIGDVGVPGSAEYDNGEFTVRGSGVLETYWQPIPDKFHFVYQQVSGNFMVTARLKSTTDPYNVDESKAGLMIRETLDVDSAHVTLSVEPSAHPFYLFRRQTGHKPVSEAKNVDPNEYDMYIPKWIRMVRYENQISTYESEDGGNTWVTSYGGTLPSSLDTLYVGLIACASTQNMLCEAKFDNVTIEPLDMDYRSHFIGNSFGGGGAFVQQAVDGMYVHPDTGLVYVACRWDEGTREAGIYTSDGKFYTHCEGMHPEGGYAITASSKYLFVGANEYDPDILDHTNNFGVRRYDLEGFKSTFPGAYETNWLIVSNSGHIRGLAVNDQLNELYVSRTGNDNVRVLNQDTMSQIRDFYVNDPHGIAIADDDTLWIVDAGNKKVLHYDRFGTKLPEEITGLIEPRGIAISPVDGRIYVCEYGWKNQILIYHPDGSFDSSFGVEGGVTVATTAGQTGQPTVRGEIHPLKFNGPTGVGVDQAGNIYVGTNGPKIDADTENTGSVIRKFDPAGNMLWQRYGLEFVDCADADWDSDAVDVFTKHAHYVVDFTKGPGEDVTYKGFTMDLGTYSGDWRRYDDTVHYAGVMIRVLDGARIMYITKQMGNHIYVYRFEPDSEIAVPVQDIYCSEPYGFYVDSQGDIWSRYQRREFLYLDGDGDPVYGGAQSWSNPSEFQYKGVQRAMYEPETDRMFLGGYTNSNRKTTTEWGAVGKEIICYNNWSSGRSVAWRTVLYFNFDEGDWPKSADIAGDYVFVALCKSARVFVYNKSNGNYVRTLRAGPEVAGMSGWVDTVNGIRAFQRSNGEYVVFVEEDFQAKVIMYRFGGPEQPPAAPQNLVAAADSAVSVTLSWQDSSEDEEGFQIERKTGGSSFANVGTVGMYSESYTDTGLQPDTTYIYRVAAYNDFGLSGYSSESQVTTPPMPTVPQAPSDLSAQADAELASIDLTWTDNADNEQYFQIERHIDTDPFAIVATVTADVTGYTDNGLLWGTRYIYRVCAVNVAGSSGYSNIAAATTPVQTGTIWVDDVDPAITYTGTWNAISNQPLRYQGTYHETSTNGSEVEFSFVGSSIKLIGEKQPFGERMDLYIDGVWKGSVDFQGDTAYQQEIYTRVFTDPGLHTIRLVCPGVGWNYIDAFVYEAVAAQPPEAPTDLTATVPSQFAEISLGWTDNSDVEDGFTIERKSGSSDFQIVGTTTLDQTSYIDTGLEYITTYTYRVCAYNSMGDSGYSNEALATTPDPPAPNPPMGLTVIPANAKLTVQWIANVESNVLYYVLHKATESGGPYNPIAVTFGGTSITDSNVVNGTTYYYVLTAVDTWPNESGYSSEVYSTPSEQTPPFAPYNLQATPVSDSQIDLSWNDGSQNEDGFIVERKSDGGTYEQIATPAANQTVYTDTGLSVLTTYTYRVCAYNIHGNSAYCAEVISQTLSPPPPTAPDGLVATAGTINTIDLVWNDNSTDEDGFGIERKSGGSYELIDEVGEEVVSYTDLNLNWQTTYTYRVYAYNQYGNSDYSNESSDTTPELIVLQQTMVDDTDPSIIYSGSWSVNTSANGRYMETIHESSNSNAIAEFTFTGVGVELIGEMHSWGGEAEIFIDDISQGTVNFYSSSQVLQAPMFVISDLPEAAHTIRVEHAGGDWIYVDAFLYSYYGSP